MKYLKIDAQKIFNDYEKLLNAECENCKLPYHSCNGKAGKYCPDCRGLRKFGRDRLKNWRIKNHDHDLERDKQKRIQNNL